MKLKDKISIKAIEELIQPEKIIGNKDYLVTGINEIHKVEDGDVTFVDHPKYYDKVLKSAASVVIIDSENVENPHNKILIISKTPFKDYNFLTKYFNPFIAADRNINQNAKIGKGTILQPNVFIGPNVEIGENCIIHPNVVIYENTKIGDNVIIHANCVIASDAFYMNKKLGVYTKMHSCGSVIIEDDVEIGAGCTIDRGVSSATIIGKGTKMDNLIHIGHDTIIGKNCLFAAQVGIGGVVNVEDDVIMWGQVGVSKDLTIGKGAVLLGKSGIPGSLEAGKTYFGYPAGEAREKMREVAFLKSLPKTISKIEEKLKKENN
jgi:UDP-3-O-[3-hydroxymyristoyl] glucosamine N-acyltransferase